MPRPKRTLAEVDTNVEPAPAAKKTLTGRGKAKGKENEVPVTKRAPVAKATAKKSTTSKAKKAPSRKAEDYETILENEGFLANKIPVPIAAAIIQKILRAKKAASDKAKDNRTESPVPQIAPTVDVADIGEMVDAEIAKVVAAAVKSNDKTNDGIALPKSNKSIQPSAPKGTTKASNTKKAATSSKASSNTSSKAKSVAKDENGKVSRRASGKTWICICRPSIEIEKEQMLVEDVEDENKDDEDEVEDDEDEDDEDEDNTCGGAKECLCYKLADDHPEHNWIVTKKGYELMKEWLIQADKRCPDNFDMYIFNDFYGYGICEVIENMFLAFDKEQNKATQDPLIMWSIMEGMVMFLRNCDQMPWHMIEDSGGNAKRIMLIGTALLTTIDILIQKGLFTNNSSKIRNIGLILSMFLQFAADESEIAEGNEDGWKNVVVEKADAHGVTIQGLVGINELVQSIREEGDDSDSDTESPFEDDPNYMRMAMLACYTSGEYPTKRTWKHYCWEIELEVYRETQAFKIWPNGMLDEEVDIGGNFYDLTAKRNKGAHMKRYKLGGGRSGGWF